LYLDVSRYQIVNSGMTAVGGMWPTDDFGVVRWGAASEPPLRLTGQSAVAVRSQLATPGPMLLEVHADTPTLALSDFLVWLNGRGMARVRIDEHCEHTPATRSGKRWLARWGVPGRRGRLAGGAGCGRRDCGAGVGGAGVLVAGRGSVAGPGLGVIARAEAGRAADRGGCV
jgi:hypothetical protein